MQQHVQSTASVSLRATVVFRSWDEELLVLVLTIVIVVIVAVHSTGSQ